MKSLIRPLLAASLVAAGCAFAADDPPPKPTPKDAVIEQAREAIAQKNWGGAQKILREALPANSRDPNYHNLYAYSVRNGANPDMSLVFKHYNEALALDPKHRGAHEYLGEAYLMVGNVAKAKEHLGQLDKLCFFGCSEYTELKNAIAEHEKKIARR
jgi:Flp pilus assembly protein TadD